MKKYSKLLLLIGLIVFSVGSMKAIENDTLKVDYRQSLTLDEAGDMIRNTYNPQLQQIALKKIIAEAKSEKPKAMHLMGMAYSQGIVVEKDFDKAIKWFKLANSNGYRRSAYNIAMMYRLGTGVEQDFNIAYKFICRAGEQGDSVALYGRGYFLYKGLGCTQSYTDAIKFFEISASKGYGRSMYMLGLMYRNGYGVIRDNIKAKYWLAQASKKRIKSSFEELATDTPENPLRPTMIRSVGTENSKQGLQGTKFNKVNHTVSSAKQLQGTYTGSLATYDFSGQYVIKESPLEMTIEQDGDGLIARWKEDTLSEVVAKCILTDTAIIFTKTSYIKMDRYHPSSPIEWNFVKAKLSLLTDSDVVHLSGNLQLYSPDTKEPGKPMCMSLRTKVNSTTLLKVTANSTDANTDPMVYPNPFSNLLNLSFYLKVEALCHVAIYSDNGSKIYEEPFGKLSIGMHRYQLMLNLEAGNYIVKITYGDKVYTSLIIKESK